MRTLAAILLSLTTLSTPAHAAWRLFGRSKPAQPTQIASASVASKLGPPLVKKTLSTAEHGQLLHLERTRTDAVITKLGEQMTRLYKMKRGVQGWGAHKGAGPLFDQAMAVAEAASRSAAVAATPELAEQFQLRALTAIQIAGQASDLRRQLLRVGRPLMDRDEGRLQQIAQRLGIPEKGLASAIEAASEKYEVMREEMGLARAARSSRRMNDNLAERQSSGMQHLGYRSPMQQSFNPTVINGR